MTPQQHLTHVAVAVIRRADGKVLFAERPAGKACAGEWEFPGGKIEAGESPRQALHREIEEELAINITEDRPWITITHNYPHASVLLHFFIVTDWTGHAHGRENQRLAWQDLSDMTVQPLLAANAPVIRALRLPDTYAISCAGELGTGPFLERLSRGIGKSIRMLQLREKELSAGELETLAINIQSMTQPARVPVLVNSSMPDSLLHRFQGLHLTSPDLMACDQRPAYELVAASCHDRDELDKAASLGLDFVVLSPVMKTPSHPQAEALGLQRMAELIKNYPLPVYALGGMNSRQLDEIQSLGAHGIAMMRKAWES